MYKSSFELGQTNQPIGENPRALRMVFFYTGCLDIYVSGTSEKTSERCET